MLLDEERSESCVESLVVLVMELLMSSVNKYHSGCKKHTMYGMGLVQQWQYTI